MAGNTINIQGSYIDVHDNETVYLNVDKAQVNPNERSTLPLDKVKNLNVNDAETPEALRSEEAQELIEGLVEAGLLDEAWQPVGLSGTERAEVAMQVAQKLNLREVWQTFAQLWQMKPETLRAAFNKGRNQRKILNFQDKVKHALG